MLIGLDGIPLSELRTGVGHYTFELARGLAENSPSDDFEIVSPRAFANQPENASGEYLPGNLRTVHAKASFLEKHWWTIGLPRYIRRNGVQLFHGTNYEAPLRRVCPVVLTIHDLSLLLYPRMHEKRRVLRGRLRLSLMTRAATMVITPTETVRREVSENLRLPLNRIVAVPEAQRSGFRRMETHETAGVRKRLGIEDDFLLFVGTIEPRKDLITLVRAFMEVLRETPKKLQLVIAGKKGWMNSELFDYIEKSGIGDRLLFTGYLPDESLCALYSSCRIFIYPSVYEGFGLPVLEAMVCGAPVVASEIPSLIEVAGEAAHLVTPHKVDALARSITRLINDLREQRRLSTAGLERSSAFSWKRTALLTRGVYTEACKRFSLTENKKAGIAGCH